MSKCYEEVIKRLKGLLVQVEHIRSVMGEVPERNCSDKELRRFNDAAIEGLQWAFPNHVKTMFRHFEWIAGSEW